MIINEMNMKKTVLFLLLILIPLKVFSQVSGKIGSLDWVISNDRVLTISGNGSMPDYQDNTISIPWGQYSSIIERVVILEGVLNIGNNVFAFTPYPGPPPIIPRECNIIEVVISNTVKTIGRRAFEYCNKIEKLIIPNSVTSIGDYAFRHCESIQSVVFSENLTSIGNGAFMSCGNLSTLILPLKLEKIDNYTFQYCSNLSYIIIPSNIKTIGGYSFSDCTKLESVDIKYGLTNIGYMAFGWCTNLKKIIIPESVDKIESCAFERSGLVSILIPKNISSIGDRILGFCNNLIEINVESENNNYCSIDGVLYNKNKSELIQYPSGKIIKDFIIPKEVKSIVDYSFAGNSYLEKLFIPSDVNNIGIGSFSASDQLQEIKVEWLNPIKLLYNDFFGFDASKCKLLVPKGTSGDYKSAFVWKNFIIEEYDDETSILTYLLTVNNGSGGGNYAEGTPVNITANTPPGGKQFKNWTSSNGGTFGNANSPNTTFTMPSNSTTVTANYEDIPANTYALTVISGTGSGNYAVNTIITITANTPPGGKQFKNWTSSNGGAFGNENSPNTTFTMPSNSTMVTANYEDIPATTYVLTVIGGTGSGNYAVNTVITITANTPPNGTQFKNWTSSNGGTFGNENNTNTIFIMPSNATTVTANYEDIPATTYSLIVSGGTGSGNYAVNTVITITANVSPSGKQFKNWTSSNGGTFGNENSAITTFTMPSNATTVTANYEDIDTGIEKVNSKIRIYGRKGAIIVENVTDNTTLNVYNFNGVLVYNGLISYEKSIIIPKGIYLTRVTLNTGVGIVKTVIVQ